MENNTWVSFADEGYLFYIITTETNSCQNFIDEGHLFYIQPPWYANKQVAKCHR